MRAWRGDARLVASFALSLCACGDTDIIDHDSLLDEPVGNVEEAEALCGPLPSDVVPIGGLETAWAVDVIPVKDRDASFRVGARSLVIRLSDEGVPCEGPVEPELLGCPRSWGVDVIMSNTEAEPGVIALDDFGRGYDLTVAGRDDGECVREQYRGGFGAGAVEILGVTDECVVGRLVDTADALEEAGSPIEGGFVALRCQSFE